MVPVERPRSANPKVNEMIEFLATILVPITLIAVLAALGLGLYSMLRGGDYALAHGNKFMRLRVGLQLTAVVLIVLTVYLNSITG